LPRERDHKKLSREIVSLLLIVVAVLSVVVTMQGLAPQILPKAQAFSIITCLPTCGLSWTYFPSLTYAPSTMAPPFYFMLTLSPAAATVVQGGVANFMILVTYSDPSYYGTPIQTQVTGGYPGMQWNISPDGSLTITTSPTTAPGTYPFTVIGTSYDYGVTNQVSGVLTVTASATTTTTAFSFSVTVSPSTQNVVVGNTVSYTVTVSSVSGQGQVSLSVQGMPQEVMGSFSTQTGTPPFTSTLNLQISNTALIGTYTFTVSGAGPNQSSSATAMLTINQKQPVSVTLSAQVGNNQLITVTGSMSPPINEATLQVTYTAPNGGQTRHTVAVNADGTYQDTFTASTTGAWTVVANYQGDNNYLPAASPSVTLTIQNSIVASLMNPTTLLAIGLGVVVVVLAVAMLRRRTGSLTRSSTSTASSVYCRSCGAKMDPTDRFCKKCGKEI